MSSEKNKNKVTIDSRNINKFEIPENLMHQMRSSVIFAGAILGRYQKAKFSYPGGLRYLVDTSDKHKINEWIQEFKP